MDAIDPFTRADTLAEHLRPLLLTVVRVGRVPVPGDWKTSWPGPPASAAVSLRANLSPSLLSSPRHLPAPAQRGLAQRSPPRTPRPPRTNPRGTDHRRRSSNRLRGGPHGPADRPPSHRPGSSRSPNPPTGPRLAPGAGRRPPRRRRCRSRTRNPASIRRPSGRRPSGHPPPSSRRLRLPARRHGRDPAAARRSLRYLRPPHRSLIRHTARSARCHSAGRPLLSHPRRGPTPSPRRRRGRAGLASRATFPLRGRS